jgi:hypothetical protein
MQQAGGMRLREHLWIAYFQTAGWYPNSAAILPLSVALSVTSYVQDTAEVSFNQGYDVVDGYPDCYHP